MHMGCEWFAHGPCIVQIAVRTGNRPPRRLVRNGMLAMVLSAGRAARSIPLQRCTLGRSFMKIRSFAAAFAASVALPFAAALATDLEVTHWWTSGGEAAAVAEFAKAFDATGNKWVDGAIAGSGDTARPIMISRITGGDPMGATQFNHGRQAEELVEAGLMRDLTDLATKENWAELVNPPTLLETCTLDGKIYCVPVNIHSWQWMWLSNKAFADAGVPVPTNWDEFVAAAPALEKAGKVPLAHRQAGLAAIRRLQRADGGDRRHRSSPARSTRTRTPKWPPAPRSPRCSRRPTTPARWRPSSNVQNWNEATTWSSPARPAARSWATGRRANSRSPARSPARTIPACPASACNAVIATGGDAFYFPKVDDPGDQRRAGDARLRDAVAGDAGRLQPQEGLAAGARRRRPRRPPTTA